MKVNLSGLINQAAGELRKIEGGGLYAGGLLNLLGNLQSVARGDTRLSEFTAHYCLPSTPQDDGPLRLLDRVKMRPEAKYAGDWKDAELVIVGLAAMPNGKINVTISTGMTTHGWDLPTDGYGPDDFIIVSRP